MAGGLGDSAGAAAAAAPPAAGGPILDPRAQANAHGIAEQVQTAIAASIQRIAHEELGKAIDAKMPGIVAGAIQP
eukprot:5913369-Pyramimonas_sp.AAC.1